MHAHYALYNYNGRCVSLVNLSHACPLRPLQLQWTLCEFGQFVACMPITPFTITMDAV